LYNLIVPEMGIELLSSYLGDTDLSHYDLNTPFENIEVEKGNNIQSRVDLIKDTANDLNLYHLNKKIITLFPSLAQ
jgi:hypothetical protein